MDHALKDWENVIINRIMSCSSTTALSQQTHCATHHPYYKEPK